MTQEAIVTIKSGKDAIVATVHPAELDYESSGQLRSAVVAAGAEAPNLPLVLDMSSVDFVPSVAIGALITLTRLFSEANQRFIMVGVKKSLRETLAVCRLDKMFEMYDTPEQAFSRLHNS